MLNTIDNDMDKLQDAPDFASKHLEDRVTGTPWEPQRPERAERNIAKNERKESSAEFMRIRTRGSDGTRDSVRVNPPRAARGREESTAVRRSCHKQHVTRGAFGARGDDDPDVPVPRQDRHGEQQYGSTGHADQSMIHTRDLGREVLTDHQHRTQEHKNTRDLGQGGSHEESSAQQSIDSSFGGTAAWKPTTEIGERLSISSDSKPWRGARQEPRRTTRTTRQPQRSAPRREVVESARRVCQGAARGEVCPGATRDDTVATTTRSRGDSRPTRYPSCRAKRTGGRGSGAQRESHGVPWWAAHGVP